jgi:D-alanyl-D-alanine carboxypeptidase
VGGASGFAKFLVDQPQPHSVQLNGKSRRLLYTPQQTKCGALIPMTPGWHVGNLDGRDFFYKEGRGGGFRCMMRVYPKHRVATVVVTNTTDFDTGKCLDTSDRKWF